MMHHHTHLLFNLLILTSVLRSHETCPVSSHYVAYALANFKVATSNALGGDAFI